MKRKLLSLVLAFAMTASLATVGAGAAEPAYGDTAGHWAESSIDRWSGYGVVQGSDGDFLPDGELTCAQLATILAKLLALPAAQSAGFTDNPVGAWYSDAINRCAAAGILNGNGDGTVSPTATISRERAMVMLGRALGVEPVSNPDLTKYGDAAQVAPYAQGMVAALIDAGIVGGVTADTLAPQGEINRASTVTILDRAIGTYANTDGATVDATESKGITLVVANNVTVTGKVDTLIVASSDNSVKLDGATVEKVSVTGEGSTVVLNNAEVKTVVASGTKAAVETTGTTKVETLSVTGTNAAVTTTDNTTVGTLTVSAENAAVETKGNTKVETVAVTGAKSEVKTTDNTTVGTLTVSAENASVETTGNTKVETVAVTGAKSEVKTTDNTTVGTLEVSAENASVTTEGKTKVETLAVTGTNTAVETKGSTKIENVAVSEAATGTTVTTGSGTTISKVENKAEGTTVTGSGTVKAVESSTNVAVETKGTKVESTGDTEITVTDSTGKETTVDTGESSTTKTDTTPVHYHSYIYTDNGDGTHTGECYANDRTLTAEDHIIVDNKCSVCGAAQKTTSVASVETANGYAYYDTLAEAIENVEENGTITLVADENINVADYNVNKRLRVSADGVTIDLNGKTLTVPNYTLILEGNNITLKNGEMKTTTTNSSQTYGSYAVVPHGKNITITGVKMLGGINVTGDNSGNTERDTTVKITNCEITATNFYTVCAQSNAEATIENTKLIGGTGTFFWVEEKGYSEGGAPLAKVSSKIIYDAKTVKFEGDNRLYNPVGVAVVAKNLTVKDAEGEKQTIDAVAVSTEAHLRTLVAAGENVMLASDITLPKNTTLEITKSVTIVGNGHKLIADYDTEAGRVINIESPQNAGDLKNITLTLSGVNIVGPTDDSYNRGVSAWGVENLTIIMDNCSASANHYALNIASDNTNAKVIVRDTTLTGYSAFQTWSESTNATFENCTLNGINQWSGGDDDYATIVLVNSGGNDNAKNSTLTFKNCNINATEKGTANENLLNANASRAKITFVEGCKFFVNSTEVTGDNIESNMKTQSDTALTIM